MNKITTVAAALMLLSSSAVAFAQNNNNGGNNQGGGNGSGNGSAASVGNQAADESDGRTKDCQKLYGSSMTEAQRSQCSSTAQQGTGANPDSGITVYDQNATGSTGAATDNSTDSESGQPAQ